jgi:hypothetical protein
LTTTLQLKRGTRAKIDALASKGGLLEGEPLFITDEKKLAVASSISAYDDALTNNLCRQHFYSYTDTNSTLTNRYVHLKTNIVVSAAVAQMYSLKFQGHSFNESKAVDANLVFYSYIGSIINTGNNGTHVCSAYKSADNFAVLTILFPTLYYVAFSLSQFITAQGLAKFNITNSTVSTSATGVY